MSNIPSLSIVCVSYKRYKEINVLIHCFLSQTIQNFNLHILHDGPDPVMEKILKEYADKYPEITYEFTEKRFNDWGHSLRSIGLQKAIGDYVLITNDDNYYSPKFIEIMFEPIQKNNADIVVCDMVHGHANPGSTKQLANCFFETGFSRGYIDIGCFIARTSLAKQAGFNDRSFSADGAYFEDILKLRKDLSISKIKRVLFVHN